MCLSSSCMRRFASLKRLISSSSWVPLRWLSRTRPRSSPLSCASALMAPTFLSTQSSLYSPSSPAALLGPSSASPAKATLKMFRSSLYVSVTSMSLMSLYLSRNVLSGPLVLLSNRSPAAADERLSAPGSLCLLPPDFLQLGGDFFFSAAVLTPAFFSSFSSAVAVALPSPGTLSRSIVAR